MDPTVVDDFAFTVRANGSHSHLTAELSAFAAQVAADIVLSVVSVITNKKNWNTDVFVVG